jgi:hypothetical protein
MAHLIEEYAKSLGVKIGKPVILDHFYPVLDEKYITIHSDNKIDSKSYEYFPQVILLLKPILNKYGYKIYQIGGPQDPPLENADGRFLNLTYKQSAYLLKKSSLHIGIDSLPIHIASSYDIPIVALYSHIYPSNAYPYWSSSEKIILLESDKKGNKPSFAYQEQPKTIRTIKPEDIANSVLQLLNIEDNINFKTLKIGSHYHIPIVEVVPNFRANLEDQKNKSIYIRADLHCDDQTIAFWCHNHKTKIITNKKLPIALLAQFNKNIEQVFFKIDEEDIELEYLEQIKKLKINFILCTKDKENLAQLRNKYFDFKLEYDDTNERILKIEKMHCKFFTNKLLISKGKLFASEAHAELNKPLDRENETVYNNDAFWKDAEHFYFYEQSKPTNEIQAERGRNDQLEGNDQIGTSVSEQGLV